jgi:hypothetical protein
MQINDPNSLTLIERTSKEGSEKVELKLDRPIPKELHGKIINAKITRMHKDGTVRLTLPNGKHITGKLDKPLPEGTKLVFTVSTDGKVKVLQVNIPEGSKGQGNQQGDSNSNSGSKENSTQQNNQNATREQTTSKQQPTINKNVSDKNLQQPVKIQTVGNKPLPLNMGTKLDVTLMGTQLKNGLYEALLPDGKTKVHIQLPKPLPEGTRLTIRILAHNEARILDVKPATHSAADAKPLPNAKAPAATTTATTTTPITGRASPSPAGPLPQSNVTENISLSGIAKNRLAESGSSQSITTLNPLVLKQVQVLVPQSAKVDLLTQVIKVLQPQTTTPTETATTNITSLAGKKTASPQAEKIASKSTPQHAASSTSSATTGTPKTIKLPLNTPIMGNVSNLPTKNLTKNSPTHLLKLPQGASFEVKSALPIVKGATMAIRFSSDGIAEVLRIVEPTPVGRDSEGGQQQSDTQQNTSLKTEAPANNLEKALKLTPGTRFTAIVSSKSSNGLQTLSLPDGRTFQAHSNKALPIGSEVTVKITPNGDAEITQLNLPQANAKVEAVLEFSRRWEGLEKALQVLRKSHPHAASKLEAALPNPGKALLPTLLQFAEAVSNQSALKFLGDETLNLLRSLGIDFTADLSSLNQLQQRTDAPDNWRAFYFPFLTDDKDLDQGSMYWRNKKDEDGNKNTRFVVNLSLSEIGPVQIDGLMQDKTMMLKVRLHELPTENFEDTLNDIVQTALEPLEITGKVNVEITNSFETDPLHEILQQESHTGLIV